MAQRRMFSKNVARTDAFLDMSQTAQNLYFHLGIDADDDGFVSPKMIMRMLGSTSDDLKILIAKSFVIPFDDGVIVIRHWRVNNEIRQDRYKETQYTEHKEKLGLTNGIYDVVLPMVPPDGDKMSTRVRLGKDRLGKDSNTIPPAPSAGGNNELNLLIEKFKPINPSYEKFFKVTTQRDALNRLVKKFGFEKVSHMIDTLQGTNAEQFAPTITTPLQLEDNLGRLIAFLQRKQKNKPGIITI